MTFKKPGVKRPGSDVSFLKMGDKTVYLWDKSENSRHDLLEFLGNLAQAIFLSI
jgi:hypothetical protein